MKFEQTWIPDYSYCIICGTKTESETCSSTCKDMLSSVRDSIELRKYIESQGVKEYNEKTIKDFNRIQDIISRKQ